MRLEEISEYLVEELRVPELGPCLIWQGGRDAYGYGIVYIHGIKNAKKLHHTTWFLEYRYWPKQLNHKCNQKPCGNTDHLYEGSQRQNAIDIRNTGSRINQKLDLEMVNSIRQQRKSGTKPKILAIKYKVSEAQISRIINNSRWVE